MWEFEDLTEMAVILISQSDLEARKKRDFFANLYSMQELFDCSFTHFRQRQPLQDAHFLLRIDPEQHPEYAAHPEYFKGLVADGKNEWVKLPSDERYSSVYYSSGQSKRPEHAYPGGLYFDVRSDLWEKCRESSVLQGPSAEPFETWTIPELVARLMQFAASQPESALRANVMKGYYGWALLAIPDMLHPEARANERLQAARELPELRKVLTEPAPDDWIDERLLPSADQTEYLGAREAEVFRWLLEPYHP